MTFSSFKLNIKFYFTHQILLFFFDILIRYVEIAKMLIESGSKIDFREPTEELYPRTMLCDEPLRLAMKNRNYVSDLFECANDFKFMTFFISIHSYIRKWHGCC